MSTNAAGATAQDNVWKSKEQGEELQYAKAKEQTQLAALKEQLEQKASIPRDDIEGGFGGQEDLEDRYATTSGEH